MKRNKIRNTKQHPPYHAWTCLFGDRKKKSYCVVRSFFSLNQRGIGPDSFILKVVINLTANLDIPAKCFTYYDLKISTLKMRRNDIANL